MSEPRRGSPRQPARSLRGYRLSNLPGDLVAGSLIVAVGIPISMGMAEVAGVAPVVGLYSCILPLVAYALLGSSLHLVVALDASTAAMLAAAVTPLAAGDPALHASLAATTALMVGAILVIVGLARGGIVAALLSHPVLLGYQAGLAVVVAGTQLPKLIGIEAPAGTTVEQLSAIVRGLGDAHLPTSLLGLACLAGVALASRRWPKAPAALIAIVVATAAVELIGGVFVDVAVVGSVPSGLPPLGLADASVGSLSSLLPAALAIALIASADTIVTSRAFAERGGYEVDASTDMVGLGAANLASGLSGGITISASAARTAVVELVGGRSQMAGIAASVMMGAVLLFLTRPLESLPLTALAAVVMGAVARLVDLGGFRSLWRIDRIECGVGVATAVASVWLGLLEGIGVGVALSLALLLTHVSPRTLLRSLRGAVTATVGDGVLVLRPASAVVYLNATRTLDGLRRGADQASGVLVVDASLMTSIDATGALVLSSLATSLERHDVDVIMAGLAPDVDATLARAGFWDGPDRIDSASDVAQALTMAKELTRLGPRAGF